MPSSCGKTVKILRTSAGKTCVRLSTVFQRIACTLIHKWTNTQLIHLVLPQLYTTISPIKILRLPLLNVRFSTFSTLPTIKTTKLNIIKE